MWNEQELGVMMSIIAYTGGNWPPEDVAKMYRHMRDTLTQGYENNVRTLTPVTPATPPPETKH